MAGLAPGEHNPVLTLSMMGVSALIIGSLINPLAGLIPLFGMTCLMGAVFMGYFWRDPDRPVPRHAGVLVAPADGRVMFLRRGEPRGGARPKQWKPVIVKRTTSPAIGFHNPSSTRCPLPQSSVLRPFLKEKSKPPMCGGWRCSCRRSTST